MSSRAEAQRYLEAKLAGFGRERSKQLYARYAAVGGANETLAAAPAYALNADTGITCGSLALALAAASARGGKKVYLSQVTARPDHPLHAPYGLNCDKPSKYAFHLWDWIAAMRAAAPVNATSTWPQRDGLDCGAYGPSADDVAFGRALLEQWVTFAEHAGFPESGGNAQVGWRAVNEAEGWPRHYAHGVIGARGATTSVVDYKTADCDAWRAAGVDEAWWWIN